MVREGVMRFILVILVVLIDVLLLIAGINDIKNMKISRYMIAVLFLLSIMAAGVYAINEGSVNLIKLAGGASIGLCMLGISMITNEQIGKGDGLVLTALGIFTGFRNCLVVVCIASFIMAGVSIIILILKKGNGSTRIAFIPAIFVSFTYICINNSGFVRLW